MNKWKINFVSIQFQKTYELQNNIHSIEVKIREALHIQKKYNDVNKSLKRDASKFESSIIKLEEEVESLRGEIAKLEQVNIFE